MNAEPVVMRERVGRRMSTTIAIAVAAALLTSACAAGRRAQTATEKSTIDGVNADLGDIGLRAVAIEAPPIGSASYRPRTAAELTLVLVNKNIALDTLSSITGSAIGGWAQFPDHADAFAVQQASLAAAAGTPSPAPSAAPLPTGNHTVVIPAGGRIGYGTPESNGAILLMPLSKTIYPGSNVKLTFTFANAGSITVAVPVQVDDTQQPAELGGASTEQP